MADTKKPLTKSMVDMKDVERIVKIIVNNWYWFVIFPSIASIISFFYLHRLTDVYGVKNQLLLKSNEVYDYQSQLFKTLGYFEQYQDVTNQIRVLQSYDLIALAVNKLDIDVSYYIVGRLKTTETFGGMPFKVEMKSLNNNLYGALFDFKIVDHNRYEITYLLNDEPKGGIYKFDEEVIESDFIMTVRNIAVKRGYSTVNEINYKFKVNRKGDLISKYKGSISIKNIEYSSILDITVQDEIPERGKMFLDTLSAVYIKYSIQNHLDMADNTLEYINKQLNEVSILLGGVQSEYENYKFANSIIDLSKEEQQFYSELINSESAVKGIELKMENIRELENYIVNSKDERFLPPSLYVLDDSFVKSSVSQLYSMQLKRTEVTSTIITETNPDYLSEQKKEETLKKSILLYLKNMKDALTSETSRLNSVIRENESKILSLPKTQRELLDIERKKQINEKLYFLLLEKRENTIITKAAIVPQTKVIEEARSIGVVRPDRTTLFYNFLIAGLGMAFLISVVKVLFYEKIESTTELMSMTRLTVVGGLPIAKDYNDDFIYVDNFSRSNVTEAFRSIRANLQYLLTDNVTSKIILVSSIYPGEGKTFCSANLAAIIAKAGKKVLLIDLDLHKPKIHKLMLAENSIGVSSYVVSDNDNFENYVSKINQNMDVMFAGPVPPNPSELIMHKKVEEILQKARAAYDFVVIDTPPAGLLSDSVLLLEKVDACFFVMNTKFAKSQGIKYIEDIASKVKVPFGLVLNGLVQKKWRYYYGKYSYGYNYGYGYGYGNYGYGSYGYGESIETKV